MTRNGTKGFSAHCLLHNHQVCLSLSYASRKTIYRPRGGSCAHWLHSNQQEGVAWGLGLRSRSRRNLLGGNNPGSMQNFPPNFQATPRNKPGTADGHPHAPIKVVPEDCPAAWASLASSLSLSYDGRVADSHHLRVACPRHPYSERCSPSPSPTMDGWLTAITYVWPALVIPTAKDVLICRRTARRVGLVPEESKLLGSQVCAAESIAVPLNAIPHWPMIHCTLNPPSL